MTTISDIEEKMVYSFKRWKDKNEIYGTCSKVREMKKGKQDVESRKRKKGRKRTKKKRKRNGDGRKTKRRIDKTERSILETGMNRDRHFWALMKSNGLLPIQL